MANGWGEVSYWPSGRMEQGDWTPAIWRSYALAEAAARYSSSSELLRISNVSDLSIHATLQVLYGSFERAKPHDLGSFSVVMSKGADGQQSIMSTPDERWIPKQRNEADLALTGGIYPESSKLMQKAGHLLITMGQNSSTARLTAVANDEQYVGGGWLPVTGLSGTEAKGAAVFINSTPGRLQLMRNAGRTLVFPFFNPAGVSTIRIPDVKDTRILSILADCWERTKHITVPQFRDGECEVRRLWDEAVAEAMDWDADELTRLRLLLHNEPHVRGLGYNQYADEPDE